MRFLGPLIRPLCRKTYTSQRRKYLEEQEATLLLEALVNLIVGLDGKVSSATLNDNFKRIFTITDSILRDQPSDCQHTLKIVNLIPTNSVALEGARPTAPACQIILCDI